MLRPTLYCSLALAIALTGCVSQSKYDEMVRERDAFAAHSETLTLETEALSDVAAGLSEELAMRDEEVEMLEQTQAQLQNELGALVVAGTIKIALMRDGLHVMLAEDVLFGSGSTELKEQGRELLANLVDELTGFPYQIAVLGYTDTIPVGHTLVERFPSNWELAAARAAAVVRLLEGAGVPGDQLVVVSFGPNRPYASNDTPKGRSQNRRIEIRLRPVSPR